MKLSLFEYCLAANKEYLLEEWDAQRNVLSPERVSYGSQRRVWWTCEKGHQWEAMVKSRAGGTGCPYCSNRRIVAGENDLASAYPELAAEWDAEKNGVLSPTALPAGTTKKVWWRCGKGHTWCAAVSSRVRGAGCPVCTGKVIVAEENDLGSRFPEIAAQWHPTKNGSLIPKNCPPSSNRRVWWRCPLGHEYQAAVGARTVNGSDCPYLAPHAEWRPDPPRRHHREPPEGLVAVSGGPRLEGRGILPRQGAENRVSRVRGTGASSPQSLPGRSAAVHQSERRSVSRPPMILISFIKAKRLAVPRFRAASLFIAYISSPIRITSLSFLKPYFL